MGDDESRFLYFLDYICHGKGFSGAGNAKKGFKLVSFS